MKNLSFFILVFFLLFLSPAFAAYDNLYLVGNATEAGWDPDAAISMEKQEPVSLRGQELYRIIV